jgi:hypothetical protein
MRSMASILSCNLGHADATAGNTLYQCEELLRNWRRGLLLSQFQGIFPFLN